MPDIAYTASKSRTNRPGWSVSFRHPLRNNAQGKPGLKMRRGLGTTNEAEADRLVMEMNTLLSGQQWWNTNKRAEAEQKFSKAIVDAFYGEIQIGQEDPESLREELIQLPTKDNGYSKVLFVGTTGAGKTSLLRQLIGSDPSTDRFPSTAPAKTTIADIEVVQHESDYRGVVTFFTEFDTQANVEECVGDACVAIRKKEPKNKVADRLLNHRDQKFRLNYILGDWKQPNGDEDVEEFSFDEEPEVIDNDQKDSGLLPHERAKNIAELEDFLERIYALSKKITEMLKCDLDMSDRLTNADREAADQLMEENFEDYLYKNETFHEIVQDVLDSVRERFHLIQTGTLERHRSGWPKRWYFETSNRKQFISEIRWFSSNYWSQFGRLLTPLVCGIRVKGPFFPEFAETTPRLVLIDGQGLGHTPDSSSSVTTHITQRFNQVDVILLVDNAKQPMQAAPLSVLRSVVANGHSEKLAMAFTHFDQIKGPNLRTPADKRRHVMASVLNPLSNLRDILGDMAVRSIEHNIDSKCFMLGSVDRALERLPSPAKDYMCSTLTNLVKFCENAIEPLPKANANPVYDPSGIPFAIRDATLNFQATWLARLGLADTHEGVKKEHWTRIKALNRRIACELDVEYDTLRPVADLVAQLTESISRFLDNPNKWEPQKPENQEYQIAISRIRETVSTEIHKWAPQRILEQHRKEWRSAYAFRGKGSTFERAKIIRDIYDKAAPALGIVMPPISKQFLAETRDIVKNAIQESGGKIRLSEND